MDLFLPVFLPDPSLTSKLPALRQNHPTVLVKRSPEVENEHDIGQAVPS